MKWFDSAQIKGHRDTLEKRTVHSPDDVTIPVATAKALLAICDQAISAEKPKDELEVALEGHWNKKRMLRGRK